jgi:hypothetical protein
MAMPDPQPCRRFKHMNPTPAFMKHLPKCAACKAVIAHLNHESDILTWLHMHRN